MTRPIGKSPARNKSVRSSNLQLDEVSLIDVGAEDDNLLSGKGSFGSRSRPDPSPFKTSGSTLLESIQEDQPQCGAVNEEMQEDLPSLSLQGPTPSKKKKKKTGFNLRKSLAWNNAFFTEEGVLDPDELALVNQTFKKPVTPKQGSHKKPALASKFLNSSGIPKMSFSPIRSHKSIDSKPNPSCDQSPLSRSGTISNRPDMQNDTAKGSFATRIGATKVQQEPVKGGRSMFSIRAEANEKKKSPLSKQYLETKLKNTSGSPSAGNENPKTRLEQTNMQSFSNSLSSASKKMKDRLGMVLSGLGMGHSKAETVLMPKDGTVVPSPNAKNQGYAENARLSRCYSQLSHERFARSTTSDNPMMANAHMSSASYMANLTKKSIDKGRAMSLGDGVPCNGESCEKITNQAQPTTEALFSQNQTIANSCIPQTDIARAKPSGLRMPSPKLGFFDNAKPLSAPQITSNGLNYGKNMDSKRMNVYGSGPQPGRSASCRLLSESSSLANHAKQSSLKPPLSSTVKSAHQYSEIGGRMKGSHSASGTHSTIASRIPSILHVGSTNGSSLVTSGGSSQRNEQENLAPLMNHEISSAQNYNVFSSNTATVNKASCHHGKVEDKCGRKAEEKCIIKAEEKCMKAEEECIIKTEEKYTNGEVKCIKVEEKSIKPKEQCIIKAEEKSVKTVEKCMLKAEKKYTKPEEKSFKPEEKCIKAEEKAEEKSIKPDEKFVMKAEQKCMKAEEKSIKAEEKCIIGAGNVLQSKKNALNVPPGVKKGITALTLPSPTIISSGQENAIMTTNKFQEQELSKPLMKSENSYEIDTEVWPEVKSGAVQHSPTNKEPPKHGPWSPVKRYGQELGPFDCTKYTNPGIAPC